MKNKQHTKAMDTRLNEIRNMQSITGQSAGKAACVVLNVRLLTISLCVRVHACVHVSYISARPVMPVLAPTFSRSSTTIPTKSPAQKQKVSVQSGRLYCAEPELTRAAW